MIEGLVALPWFREKSRRGELGIDDCDRCRSTTGQVQRQSLGCGYEPPAGDRVRLTIWQPPSGEHGYRGSLLTVCAGYTTNLPQVSEVSVARAHWVKGNACVLPQDEDLLNSIVIADSAYGQLQHWLMTPSKDGGGGA